MITLKDEKTKRSILLFQSFGLTLSQKSMWSLFFICLELFKICFLLRQSKRGVETLWFSREYMEIWWDGTWVCDMPFLDIHWMFFWLCGGGGVGEGKSWLITKYSVNSPLDLYKKGHNLMWKLQLTILINIQISLSFEIVFSLYTNFPGKNPGVGWHFLLHGIFPTQASNPGLPHCRQILYHLSTMEPLYTEDLKKW